MREDNQRHRSRRARSPGQVQPDRHWPAPVSIEPVEIDDTMPTVLRDACARSAARERKRRQSGGKANCLGNEDTAFHVVVSKVAQGRCPLPEDGYCARDCRIGRTGPRMLSGKRTAIQSAELASSEACVRLATQTSWPSRAKRRAMAPPVASPSPITKQTSGAIICARL